MYFISSYVSLTLFHYLLCIFPEAWGACESRIGGTYDFQSEYWKDIKKASAEMIALDLVVGRLTFRLASVTHQPYY